MADTINNNSEVAFVSTTDEARQAGFNIYPLNELFVRSRDRTLSGGAQVDLTFVAAIREGDPENPGISIFVLSAKSKARGTCLHSVDFEPVRTAFFVSAMIHPRESCSRHQRS